LAASVEQLAAAGPALVPDPRRTLVLQPGATGKATAWRAVGSSLTLLMTLAGATLLLECFTIAGLLIVRSLARQRETAVKLALGARRSHLISQCLTETLLLAVLGGTIGILVAPWVTGLLVASQGTDLSIDTRIDWRVLAFATTISLTTGVVVGLAPILAGGGRRAAATTIGMRTATSSRRHMALRDAIVACQVGASLATVIVAALLVQSLRALNAIDPGFAREPVVLISMDPGPLGYDAARIEAFWRTALERIAQIPGVQAASLANTVPLAPGRQRQPAISPVSGNPIEIDTNPVGPGYFRTLGIPVVHGREFSDADGKDSMPVVIVNERLAQVFWPGQNPLGQSLRVGSSRNRPSEVVGIVKDAKYRDVRLDADAMLYVPLFQTASTTAKTLHVRFEGPLEDLSAAIRGEVHALEPGLPLFGIRTLQDQHAAFLAQPRQMAAITSAFGIVALVLAVVGVYGVTAVTASRRVHDIGIRMALGATPSQIVRWVGRRGLAVVGLGLAIGLFGSLALTRVASSLLYGISAHDPSTFVVATAVLAVTSLAAVFVPARAATSLDAARAMRCD
jgi:predicted permease